MSYNIRLAEVSLPKLNWNHSNKYYNEALWTLSFSNRIGNLGSRVFTQPFTKTAIEGFVDMKRLLII